MSAQAALPARVQVSAADPRLRAALVAGLSAVGVAATTAPVPDTPCVVAGVTVDDALRAAPPAPASVLVAEAFTTAGVCAAVGAGVRVLLALRDAAGPRLVAALAAATHGDGRMPPEAVVAMLSHPTGASDAAPSASEQAVALTGRQRAVLALMTDGHSNSAIAAALRCSENTVRNTVHDLMSRMQVRNRSHAVACAVREGLV